MASPASAGSELSGPGQLQGLPLQERDAGVMGSLEDEHGVAEGVEAVLLSDGLSVGTED